ncbi:RNA polymerase sigma factor [Fodinibius salsisoli]|uniref:Sigma-70 family RNA polymerase sigma factor n=1 Tax=Fodinibius salsisoli TaxID=2820877 RepID=A0ABT3PQ57_9BACT|nr:sigma-70 family RNA polymerase sigma factor [Fodinibius salsisoli]MCW9707986.1 sigma-70 family RNA polymerase sigma factor [Fodinibius salsisoli]
MFLTTVLNKDKENCSEDIRLWEELRAGDRTALSSLFNKYYTHLLNYGLKIIPNTQLVKDSIQELFISIWEYRSNLSQVEYIRSYLFSSLRRTIIRQHDVAETRQERDERYSEESFKKLINKEQLMIMDELEEEQKYRLEQAIEQLSKRQKEAVFLKFYNGFTSDEIAEIMGVNKQSVYNYISRSIDTLREQLLVMS